MTMELNDNEIRALPTTNVDDFVTWKSLNARPVSEWVDTVIQEREDYWRAILNQE